MMMMSCRLFGAAFGMTEASPTMCFVPFHLASDKNVGSCGVLLPSVSARLVDEDGSDVKDGEAGEIWIRGHNVMKVAVPIEYLSNRRL